MLVFEERLRDALGGGHRIDLLLFFPLGGHRSVFQYKGKGEEVPSGCQGSRVCLVAALVRLVWMVAGVCRVERL